MRYLSTLNRGQDSPATVSDYEAIILLIAIEREVWQRKDIEHQSPALDANVWVFHPAWHLHLEGTQEQGTHTSYEHSLQRTKK